MKKGFIALAVVALATSVFAQEAPKAPAAKAFTLSGGVDAYYLQGKTIGDTKGAQHFDYGTARSRPLFKVADGSSEFNLEFEMIGNYGIQPLTPATAKSTDPVDGGNGAAPISNDQTASMKLRGMYFSSTVAGVDGLKLTAGLCPTLDLGMWEKDLSPGFVAAYSVGKLATISAAYFQINENAKSGIADDSADADYYSATALIAPIDGLQVNLMGSYVEMGKSTPSVKGDLLSKKINHGTGWMGGAWVKGTFGQFGISGIFQYAAADGYLIGTTTKVKGAAYAFNIAPSFSLDKDTVFTVFYTNISGDDPKTTTKDESWWDACLDAQGFGHKMILFEDCGCCANLDTTNATEARVRAKGMGQAQGYQLFGATATAKIGIYQPTLAVAYGMLNQLAAVGSKQKKDLGTEIDLFNAFKISDATTLNFELAYLVTGKAYKYWNALTNKADATGSQKTQNAYSIALGMTQKY